VEGRARLLCGVSLVLRACRGKRSVDHVCHKEKRDAISAESLLRRLGRDRKLLAGRGEEKLGMHPSEERGGVALEGGERKVPRI